MDNPTFNLYIRPNGQNEFEKFLNLLPSKDKVKLLATIEKIEEKELLTAIRMKWVKKLDDNLYEIRSKVSSNLQRACYFHVRKNEYIIILGLKRKR